MTLVLLQLMVLLVFHKLMVQVSFMSDFIVFLKAGYSLDMLKSSQLATMNIAEYDFTVPAC